MGMTLAELTQAIQQHIDLEMDEEVARGMVTRSGFFGFYNRIIDNALEPTDRNLFYMFQDYDLLTTESEETTLWDGREWRIHYWKFKPDLRERVEATCKGHCKPKTLTLTVTSMQSMPQQFGQGKVKRSRIQMLSPLIGDLGIKIVMNNRSLGDTMQRIKRFFWC